MSEDRNGIRPGHEETAGGTGASKALAVASRGLRTPRDITNFAFAHSIDVLEERVGAKAANASLRGVTVGLRAIEIGQRVGQHHEVANVGAEEPAAETEEEALLREERELTRQLEALRERRGAGRNPAPTREA